MIDLLFSEVIYRENLHQFNYLNSYIHEKIKKIKMLNSGNVNSHWLCNTFNTLDSKIYNVLDDQLLSPLMQEIKNHCLFFSKEEYGIMLNNLSYNSAWLNLSEKGNYQEPHIHSSSHFSIIYYARVPENSGKTIFLSHTYNDMFPLPSSKKNTSSNSNNWIYSPNECDLVIFRSNLLHLVEENKSDQDRVTLSANLFFPI